MDTPFKETILVRKDQFRSDNFQSIDTKARAVIEKAEPSDLLALAITMNSPFRVVEARIYSPAVFESLLCQ